VVRGRQSHGTLRLWVIKQVDGVPAVNSFAPSLIATLRAEHDGTRLQGVFRMPRLVQAFLALWLTGVAAFEAGFIYAFFAGWERHGAYWLGFLLPPVFILFAFGLVRLSRWLARGTEERIVGFLRQTLSVRADERDG